MSSALLLLLLLLPVLGTFPEGPLTVRMLQTSSFFGFSSSDVEVLGLLADVEVTTLDWSSHKIHFLRPWVFPALAPTEWADLELLLNSYLGNLAHMVDQIVRQRTMTFPVVVQCSMGCREDAGSGFYDTAYDGQDFVSFTARNGSWTRRQDDELARYVEAVLNHDEGTCATMVHLFNITCIKALHRLAQHGKEDLERQVKPVAVVFAKVPNPARLLLVCRVTGFYPRPVSVAWLRDGQEVPPGPELSATPPLPNADLTYQLRSVLAVAPHDGHRYACRVQHSSLGGRSLLVPWAPGSPKTGLAAGIGIALLIAAAAIAGALWWRRRRSYEDVDAAQRWDSILYCPAGSPGWHLPTLHLQPRGRAAPD